MIKKESPALVSARELTKLFGEFKAVDNISFDVWPGEVVGFLGPNGAGKTTTIRMMLNLLSPSSGDLRLFNLNYTKNRTEILNQINATSGTLTMQGKLSVLENLIVFSDLYCIPSPRKRINDLLEKFDLVSLKDKPVLALSTGQQVRVSMAKSFLNKPRLLLLDEPTSSLDPDVADRIRSHLMQAVKEEHVTVFLTSHNMKEVEQICTRVLFINQGRIQAEGSPKELARQVKRWTVNVNKDLKVEMDRSEVGPYLTKLVKEGTDINTISIHEPTLEDFFVHSARKKQ